MGKKHVTNRRVVNVQRHALQKSFGMHNGGILIPTKVKFSVILPIFWWKQQDASLETAFAAPSVFEVVLTVIVP